MRAPIFARASSASTIPALIVEMGASVPFRQARIFARPVLVSTIPALIVDIGASVPFVRAPIFARVLSLSAMGALSYVRTESLATRPTLIVEMGLAIVS